MEIKQHASKWPTGCWRNQKGNQKFSRNKWQWKQDNSKPMICSKSSSKGKFIAIQSYLKKQEKHWIDNLTLYLKQLEKEEQKNPKISRRKEIIKIWAEINEKEMKETIVKINKTKSWFFEKIKQNWQAFSQTYQGKKREESNQQN